MRERGTRWTLAVAAGLAVSCAASGIGAPTDDAAVSDARVHDAARVRLPDASGARRDAGRDALGPPYPIVLAHGFFGFDDFAGLDFVTYFYGVKDELAARGESLVFTPAVDPFNDSQARGQELLAHVERILAQTGHARVNVVGHSQGGVDARYVAHVRPDLVASVTTYATPHRGTSIADVVLGLVDDGRSSWLADALARILGAPLWDAAGEETSVIAALRQLSTPGMAAFNVRYPNRPEVAYYSIAGRTDRHPGGEPCESPEEPPFIARYRRTLDPVDPLLDIPEQIVDGGAEDAPNDGLVRAYDARWGRFLGCVPADHLDQVGHLLGDSPGLGNDFDHRRFFVELVAWLRAQGL